MESAITPQDKSMNDMWNMKGRRHWVSGLERLNANVLFDLNKPGSGERKAEWINEEWDNWNN